jgi:AcrR family transcriptional regulator
VLAAARDQFAAKGYAGTTVSEIARRAKVSVDTVYAGVGRKPDLLLAVIDMTLGGTDEPVPAEQRAYVKAIREAPTAEAKVAAYAEGLREVMPLTAPLLAALREGGLTDAECARLREHLDERRAANMRLFAADLRSTGQLRDDLGDDEVADFVWSTTSVEYYSLLRSRGWSADRYADHLRDLWTRMLLARP